MSTAEFDRHAQDYGAQHRSNIAVSGEAPEYFAEYKMLDFKALLARNCLPMDGSYLDLGSGIGGSVGPFLRHLPDARLTCADVSAESLAISRERFGEQVAFAHIEDGTLPFADARFDGAFACCVFHHVVHEEHVDLLRDLWRVLRPGGLLMVYEHNPFNPLTVRAVRNCPFDENARLVTARQLRRRIAAAGFNEVQCDYRVFFPGPLAALRPAENLLRWLPLGAQYFVAARK